MIYMLKEASWYISAALTPTCTFLLDTQEIQNVIVYSLLIDFIRHNSKNLVVYN